MDNATYDVLKRSPTNSNETYSMLSMVSTNASHNLETQRKEYTNRREVKNNDSKGAPTKRNKSLLIVVIIMMVILLLISIASLALSVAAYNQSNSEQSTVQNKQITADNDLTEVQTQFDTTCSNISRMIFQVDTKINDLTSLLLQNTDMEPQPNCGPGLWDRVAHLNMSDPSQQCPSVWKLYDENGVRACGRQTHTGSCATKCYLTGSQYSRVCGRVIGYQVASPDAFGSRGDNQINFDGVNIASGAQRDHVWSYVAGFNEIQSQSNSKCPCSTINGRDPPPSISENYFCESGNPNSTWTNNQLFTEDKLWDGLQCEGTCCNSTMSPPWFSVQLPAPTTGIIEVSICADQNTNDEDTPIELLEIYIQ